MRCLICGSHAMAFQDEKLAVETYHCEHCGCIFKSPDTHQGIAAQKSRYDLHENDEADAGYRAYFQRFLDFVLPRVGSPKTALDFGCGKSTLLATLLQKQGIACDVHDPIYHPDDSFESKRYDLIVSTEVFEHLHDPRAIFGLLWERLEVGGCLAIQTQFLPESVDAYLAWYYRQDPTHIVFFTPKVFGELCCMTGCYCVADNGKNMVIVQKRDD